MATFGRQIYDTFPDARASLDLGNTGGAMLSVVLLGRLFVMEFQPSEGFGVDEVLEGEGFVPGYRNVFDDFDAASVMLMKLLHAVR